MINCSKLRATQGCVYFCPAIQKLRGIGVQSWGFEIKTSYFSGAFSGKKAVTGSQQYYFGLERIGISPATDCSPSLHFLYLFNNNKTTREFYKGRPFSTYKSFMLMKKKHFHWAMSHLSYLKRIFTRIQDESINMRREKLQRLLD